MNNQPQAETNEDEAIQEQVDFSKPDYVFLPQGNHTYRQAGPYLVCKSCEIQHASYVGIEKLMVGVTELGEPILKKRKELGM